MFRNNNQNKKAYTRKIRNKFETNKAMFAAAFCALTAFTGGSSVYAADSIPITIPEGTTRNSIDVTATSQDIKSAINIKGTVQDAAAKLTGGTISITGNDDYVYSAIMTEATGLITNLNAAIGSTTVTVKDGKSVSGALIKSIGDITNAEVEISNTTLTGDGIVTGGIFSVESSGSVGKITGAGFTGNNITITGAGITGGVLFNQGVIGQLSGVSFTQNTAITDTEQIYGGALANIGQINGNIENVTFSGNKAISTSGEVKGGAIYNTGIFSGKIINSTFTDNIAKSTTGTALGGAIYSTTDVYITGDGGTSLFRGNQVQDSSGTKNQAIYIDSRIAKLTLDARNGGKVLIYDNINGYDGYSLTIDGDSSGKIGLYGNVTNANVTVNNGNVDLVNSATNDLRFGQFNSSANAKYSIDLDLTTGKADKFIVNTGSKGTILIDNLNILNGMPDESKLIKVLESGLENAIGIELSDNVINSFNRDETKNIQWADEVPTELNWGDTLLKYERNDVIHRTIAATTSVYGGLTDSLQYTVTTTEGATTSSILGDTLRLINQANSEGTRTFTANTSRNLHTVSEDLGSTGTGTFSIIGVHDSQYNDITSKIDANSHKLFELDKESTLNVSDIIIENGSADNGSLFNVTNKNAVVNLNNVTLGATAGTTGVHNDGTINLSGANTRLYTAIDGTGTLNLNSGKFWVYDNANITQAIINITGGELAVYDRGVKLTAKMNVGKNGLLNIYGENVGGDVKNDGRFAIYGGTIDNAISGTGRTEIHETVTVNNSLGNAVTLTDGARLNIGASDIGGTITHSGSATNRSLLYISGGTLNHAVSGNAGRTYISGNVVSNAMMDTILSITGASDSLRINASNLGGLNSIGNTNNGTLYLTGGTLNRIINGSGSVHIVGDVIFRLTTSGTNMAVGQSVFIDENASLRAGAGRFTGGTITNDGTLTLLDGTLSRTVTGSGITNIEGPVINNVSIGNSINIKTGGELTTNASNIGGEITNDGKLNLNGGTLNYEINGKGSVFFPGGTTVVTQAINQNMSSISAVIRIGADNIGGDMNFANGAIYLGSGTLKHNIYAVTINVESGQEVIVDPLGYLNMQYGSHLNGIVRVENASRIATSTDMSIAGHLYLGSGSYNGGANGSGTIHIQGDVNRTVTTQNYRLIPKIVIEETGTLTSPVDTFWGSITNNGIFNISGNLGKTIAGSGTTNINDSVMFKENAAIAGELNFNNGILNAQNLNTLNMHTMTFLNYNIGKATGAGTFKFDIDSEGNTDTLTLGADSSALITPDITFWNVDESGFQNLLVQVLKGGSGAKLSLPESTITANIKNRVENTVTSGDVAAESTYGITDSVGTGTLDWSLAQTESAGDSLLMNLSNIHISDSVFTRKDLFKDWLTYTGATEKTFRFTNSKTTYNALEGEYSYTIPSGSSYSIIKDSIEAGTPVLNFGSRYLTLGIANGGRLDISNVEIANVSNNGVSGRTFFVNIGTARFENVIFRNIHVHANPFLNYGLLEHLSGQFISINNCSSPISNSGTITEIDSAILRNSSGWTTTMLYNTGTIGTADGKGISNTTLQSNSGERPTVYNTNTIHNIVDTNFIGNRNSSSRYSSTQGVLQNTGTINNMQGVQFDGNGVSYGNHFYAYGGALSNSGKITNGLISSANQHTQFKGNWIDAYGAKGAAIYNATSGTIKVIDGAEFNGNYINYRAQVGQNGAGGAIYNAGTITEGIKNSTFTGNYVTLTDTKDANAGYDVSGGAIYSEKLLTIENSTFTNNQTRNTNSSNKGASRGGALFGVFNIKDSTFENNSVLGNTSGYQRGGAILLTGNSSITNSTFYKNSASNYGGAISNSGSNVNIDGTFTENTSGNGGAISNEGTVANLTGTFTGNSATYGGAYANVWNASAGTISAKFIGNHATHGGAIAHTINAPTPTGTINKILNSTFEGNYATGLGGAIRANGSGINEISDSTFTGNYAGTNGGAISIHSDSYIRDGIFNTSFKDNYVSSTSNASGGAIYYGCAKTLTIGARDNGLTEFTGNYIQTNSGKQNQAIYIASTLNTAGLILDASTKGTITLNDYIDGTRGYYTHITGDGTGTLNLFNNIVNSNITADNITINAINDTIFNYNLYSLNSTDTANYGIDVNLTDGTADNFTLGYGSTGVITLDDIKFSGTSTSNQKFQIIKNIRSNVELALKKAAYGTHNVVENFLEKLVPDTVYHDGVYKQEKGLMLSTTDTLHDSIELVVNETRYDPLNIIVTKETDAERNFVFNNTGSDITYTLQDDLGDVTAGTLNINGISGSKPTIDANGHKLFNLKDETNFTVSDVNLTGADDIITVQNPYAIVNLNNVNVSGNIVGETNFKMNLDGDVRLNGQVQNVSTTVNSGNLVINRDTFAHNQDKLTMNNGVLNMQNDIAENFVINNLNSSSSARYNIDLNLNNFTADTITVNDTSASGVVVIGDINDIGRLTMDRLGSYKIQILNTNSSALTLALTDELQQKVFNLGDIRREETDTVAMVTNFDTVYYNRVRFGIIAGTMSVDTDKQDSIVIEAIDQWNSTATPTSVLGDTLQLVAKNDREVRILQANDVRDVYNVDGDIGTVTKGSLVISGVSENNERSTLNMANHRGFILGKDTTLSINNVKVTGSTNPIEITDSSAIVELNNANISGGISADTTYELSLIGNGITTIDGKLTNANATLSQGGFIFNHNTFADANTNLNVAGGQVYFDNDNAIQNYVFNNLSSAEGASYYINADMVGGIADTISVKSGSGIITLDGLTLVDKTPELNKAYTLKVLNTNGNPIVLAISDTLQSKMEGTYKLGTTGITIYDEIKPSTNWDKTYYKEIRERSDVFGHFTLNDAKDSIIVTATRIDSLDTLRTEGGDTMKLWNQLETNEERNFNFDNFDVSSDSYIVSENLGTTTSGVLNINGVKSGNILTEINANEHSLFDMSNDGTTLNINNIHFTNGRNSAGSILNITNETANVNLNNVTIDSIGSVNGINNAGVLTFTGNNTLSTGIAGTTGITNINDGAVVNINKNITITQDKINVNNGRLLLDATDVIYGSVAIKSSGFAQMSSNAITQALENDGNLTLLEGTLAYEINGAGKTTLQGSMIARASINQNLDILADSTLTTTASNIGGKVNNLNELILTGGELSNTISGSGKTVINGDVTANAKISQEININSNGALTTNAENIGAQVKNEKDLTLTSGNLTQQITGSGRTNIEGNVTLNNDIIGNAIHLNSGVLNIRNVDMTQAQQFNVHSGTVNLQDGSINSTNLGDLVLNGDMYLAVDANLSTLTGDFITANNFSNLDNHSIIINSIKVLADANNDLPLDILIADSVLKDSIKLSTETLKVQGYAPETSYLVSYNKTNGNLHFGYGNLATAVALNASERNYTMSEHENVDRNLGSMGGGSNAVLTVNGNGFSVNQNGYKGITVNDTQNLHINNVGSVDSENNIQTSWNGANSTTNGGVIQNNGNLDITNSVFYNNSAGTASGGVIYNTSTITSVDSSVFSENNALMGGAIYNAGTIETLISSVFANNSGSLGGAVYNAADAVISVTDTNFTNNTATQNGGAIFNEGTINITAADKNVVFSGNTAGSLANDVHNLGTVNLTAADGKTITFNGQITGDNGVTSLNGGTVNFNNTVSQNKLNINSGNVNVAAGYLNITNGVTNKGELNLSSGTLSSSVDGTGNVNIKGNVISNAAIAQKTINIAQPTDSLTTSASNITATDKIANAGNLYLTGGILNSKLEGTGTTTIQSTVTNQGSITQGKITVDGTLTNDSEKKIVVTDVLTNNSNITNNGIFEIEKLNNLGNISNESSFVVSNGSNSGSITGVNGTLTVNGIFKNGSEIIQKTITNSGTLTNNGTLEGSISNLTGGTINSVADNLIGAIDNNGTLNLNGGTTQGAITGSGLTNVNNDLTVVNTITGNTLALGEGTVTKVNEGGALNLGGLNANGGTIDLVNSSIDSVNLGDVTLNSDLRVNIDADLANKTADNFSATSITNNGHSIIVDTIKILSDAQDDLPIMISIANNVLKDSIKLSTETIGVAGVKEDISYLVSYSKESGELKFEYGDLKSSVHLTASERNYNMQSNELVTSDLGTMKDGKDILNINGNGFDIQGNGHRGIEVNDENTLNVNNVNKFGGFTTAIVNNTDGIVNVKNSNFAENDLDILNDGKLSFSGNNILDTIKTSNETSLSGQTLIKDGKTTINKEITQNELVIRSEAEVELGSETKASINTLTNSGSVANNGEMQVDTLTNNSDGNVTNNGKMHVDSLTNNTAGTVTNNGEMQVDSFTNNSGGNVTNSGEMQIDLFTNNTAANVTNNGKITAQISNAGSIENASNITVLGGNNSGTINGKGTLSVDGDFLNTAAINQGHLDVNAEKKLTNSGNITATLGNNGTVENTNVINLLGGENNGTINGAGTLNVNGDFNNTSLIEQNIISINTEKTLTNTADGKVTVNNSFTNGGIFANDGTIEVKGENNLLGSVSGKGEIVVSGNAVADKEVEQQTVTVKEQGSLQNDGGIVGAVTNAGSIDNNAKIDGKLTNSGNVSSLATHLAEVDNSGTIDLEGGVYSDTMSGSGTLNIQSTVTNQGSITQGKITVEGTLTNDVDKKIVVTDVLTNNANITNNGIFEIEKLNNLGNISNESSFVVSNGSNSGSITGVNGTLTVNGTFKNDSEIVQKTITNSGTFTNNGTLQGSITNLTGGTINSIADNLIGAIDNNGTLNLNGGTTQGAITGSGLTNVNNDLTVVNTITGNTLALGEGTVTKVSEGGALNLGGLNANGGTIDLVNSSIDSVNLGDVTLNSDLRVNIDADLANKTADNFSATSITNNGHSIIVDTIHIMSDSVDKIPQLLTIADETLKGDVLLDTHFNIISEDIVNDRFIISYIKEDGTLKFEYATLPIAVKSLTEQKVYVMGSDEIVTSDLGTLNGKSLIINGNNNKIIGTGDIEGITVDNDGQTLSSSDVTYTGFNTAIKNNNGTINLTNTNFENNKTDIENNSIANFYGQNSINSITGSDGTINIDSYTISDNSLVNAKLTLNEGGSITQKTINITKDNTLVNKGSVNAYNINNDGTVTNSSELIVSNLENTGNIDGTGNTTINGKSQNTGTISQNSITITDGAEFTTSSNKLQTSDNRLSNDGSLILTDGNNNLYIYGDGTTSIKGKVENSQSIAQDAVIVLEGGELTTGLDNLVTQDIRNSGILNIADYKIDKDITGTSTGVVNINNSMLVSSRISGTGVSLNDGILRFTDSANLSAVSDFIANGGAIDLINDKIEDISLGHNLAMKGNLYLHTDVDLQNESMDRIFANTMTQDGFIVIKSMKVLSDAKQDKIRIPFADEAFKNNVKTEVKALSYSPIWVYGVEYDNNNGEFVFTKGGSGAEGTYRAFNPAVLSSAVATQISGQAAMTQTISSSFQHSDWYFNYPSKVRYSKLNANKFALSDAAGIDDNFSGITPGYENRGIWYKPYSTFETVSFYNGPKVNLISYGNMVGGDSDFRELKHGWSNVGSAYIGYHGSQYNYGSYGLYSSGVSATSNGGVLGVTEYFYKGNFYTALTLSAGGSFTETHGMFGKEDIPMLMGGIASKSGYNIELNKGKFIIQPNLLMGYNFVSTFNKTNPAGVRIENKPLHTIMLNPNIRFITNTRKGWQPYATIGMVWHIMNDTHTMADGIELASMSTKPYIEYGLGIQRLWNDNFSAYGQATVRNGGRNGVALNLGLKWHFGKEGKPIEKTEAPSSIVSAKTVPPSRTVIKQLPAKYYANVNNQNKAQL